MDMAELFENSMRNGFYLGILANVKVNIVQKTLYMYVGTLTPNIQTIPYSFMNINLTPYLGIHNLYFYLLRN
jgi:hypothetical protein